MARKTLEISVMIDKTNAFLENTTKYFKEATRTGETSYGYTADEWLMQRKGVCMLLETFLFAADAYSGFIYREGWNGVETFDRIYL